jgi:replication fork protection complex subunit Csm3/Swi3
MVEKTGHKTTMRNARLKWIDESRPKTDVDDDIFDEDNRISTRPPQQAERVAPVFEKAEAAAAARERAKTPAGDGLFGEDIYNATPLRNPSNGATAAKPADAGVPDDDELDALMAEAEAQASTAPASNKPAQTAPSRSIFGGGPGGPVDDDDDDLEALIAEAEAQSAAPQTSRPAVSGSIFGDGKKAQSGAGAAQDEEDDLDAFMADVEAEAQASTNPASGTQATGTGGQKGGQTSGADDGDELDALMAEAEAAAAPSSTTKPATQASSGKGPQMDNYEDDEEALAEMGDIW